MFTVNRIDTGGLFQWLPVTGSIHNVAAEELKTPSSTPFPQLSLESPEQQIVIWASQSLKRRVFLEIAFCCRSSCVIIDMMWLNA